MGKNSRAVTPRSPSFHHPIDELNAHYFAGRSDRLRLHSIERLLTAICRCPFGGGDTWTDVLFEQGVVLRLTRERSGDANTNVGVHC